MKKIKFVGFWPEFDENDNFIINQLKKYFEVKLSNNPEYLISSCFSDAYLKYQNCVRIFYTGENLCPDFNAFDYALGFEYLQFGDRYFRYPNYLITDTYAEDYRLMLNKNKCIEKNILKIKTEFCAFVVSKGQGYVDKQRELIFRELSKYKKVNSGGRYLNNIGLSDGVEDKLAFQTKHKFVLACENSSHSGYTTEKLVQAFAAKAVPIYWGDPDIGKVFNEKAFINVNSFSNIEEVIQYVKKIDKEEELYLSMLKEPAVLCSKTQEAYNDEMGLFLRSIFDQDYYKAFRRDMVGYGKMHCDKLDTLMASKIKSNRWGIFQKYFR